MLNEARFIMVIRKNSYVCAKHRSIDAFEVELLLFLIFPVSVKIILIHQTAEIMSQIYIAQPKLKL